MSACRSPWRSASVVNSSVSTSAPRIAALKAGYDSTLEVSYEELHKATGLIYTTDLADLANCNVYIIAVPTPVDEHKRPDLSPLIKASGTIGQVLKKGDIVVYES